jgi:hypothetical protein
MIDSIITLLANFFGFVHDVQQESNSPGKIAEAQANDQLKKSDTINKEVEDAANDPSKLDNLRRH